jgi:hypothetical protein
MAERRHVIRSNQVLYGTNFDIETRDIIRRLKAPHPVFCQRKDRVIGGRWLVSVTVDQKYNWRGQLDHATIGVVGVNVRHEWLDTIALAGATER